MNVVEVFLIKWPANVYDIQQSDLEAHSPHVKRKDFLFIIIFKAVKITALYFGLETGYKK